MVSRSRSRSRSRSKNINRSRSKSRLQSKSVQRGGKSNRFNEPQVHPAKCFEGEVLLGKDLTFWMIVSGKWAKPQGKKQAELFAIFKEQHPDKTLPREITKRFTVQKKKILKKSESRKSLQKTIKTRSKSRN